MGDSWTTVRYGCPRGPRPAPAPAGLASWKDSREDGNGTAPSYQRLGFFFKK